MRSKEALETFGKELHKINYSVSIADKFRHFLDFTLYMLNPEKDQTAYDEAKYLDKIYNEEKSKAMVNLLNLWSIASDNDGSGFYDALGELFMEHISYGKMGQFFTPQSICDMMALMVYGDDLKEGQKVCDPACGSGRTLMAMAKLNRKMYFYGADVDETCCKMTLLNMIVNCMPGEVAWMNTISNKHYKSWKVELKLLGNGYYLPCYKVITTEESEIVLRLPKEIPKPVPVFNDTEPLGNGIQMLMF